MKKTLFAMVIGVVAFNVAAQCYPPEYTGNAKKDDAIFKAHILCLDLWGQELAMRRQELDQRLLLDNQLMMQFEASRQSQLMQEQNMLLEEQNDLLRKRRRH